MNRRKCTSTHVRMAQRAARAKSQEPCDSQDSKLDRGDNIVLDA